jgi:phosphoglycolate phosphatase-like HAD superfamily hydrolase
MAAGRVMHLVMFDIDGTLVDSAGFDGELYAAAVEAELGLAVDRTWKAYEHVSDSGVLEQLLREAGRETERRELEERVERRFVASVRDYLARNEGAVREIAGAKRLIERLLAIPTVRVAVATGGWAETARLKLAHIGVDAARLAFANGSDARARADIMRLAAQRAMLGANFIRATYFGDGLWDQRACGLLGYEFIAVGNAVPDCVAYADLRDTEAILARLEVRESRVGERA